MELELVTLFRLAELPQERWNHRAHLTVAISYLQEFSPVQALCRLREDIQKLNRVHGVATTPQRGYHETRTRVWLALLAHGLLEGDTPERLTEKYAHRDAVRDYYSHALLESWEARIDWRPPDIGILPLDPGGWCPTTPSLFTVESDTGPRRDPHRLEFEGFK